MNPVTWLQVRIHALLARWDDALADGVEALEPEEEK